MGNPQGQGEVLGRDAGEGIARCLRFSCAYKVVVVIRIVITPWPVFAFFGGFV